jgi:hypothetical protein
LPLKSCIIFLHWVSQPALHSPAWNRGFQHKPGTVHGEPFGLRMKHLKHRTIGDICSNQLDIKFSSVKHWHFIKEVLDSIRQNVDFTNLKTNGSQQSFGLLAKIKALDFINKIKIYPPVN